MNSQNKNTDLQAYIKALVETPITILFLILDISAIVAVFLWVVDDLSELLVSITFIVVIHIGHFLIFKRQQKTIGELENRIVDFENSIPKLALDFWDDGSKRQNLQLLVSPFPSEPDYEELIEQEKKELLNAFLGAKKPRKNEGLHSILNSLPLALGEIYKDEDDYKNECGEYLEEYRQYLEMQHYFDIGIARLRRIGFYINNVGKIPADNVIVLIDFPDEFQFLEEDEVEFVLNEAPKKPKRPKLTKSIVPNFAYPVSPAVHFTPPDISSLGNENLNKSGPFIRPKNSTEVRYEITKLMHGFGEDLDEVLFLYQIML